MYLDIRIGKHDQVFIHTMLLVIYMLIYKLKFKRF